MEKILAYIESNQDRFVSELCTYLAKPSVSTQNRGVTECAQFIMEHMNRIGIPSRLLSTPGFPVVYGELKNPSAKRTLLIYGHYDVQPPDPLEEWVSPPFTPTFRDGRLYARGAGDNKGPHFAHLKAIEAWLVAEKALPVNLKIILEGEEEMGSQNLPAFVEEHKDLLAADFVYAADGPMHDTWRPLVFLGLRGIVTFELRAKGANQDFHSGNFGGVAPNPVWDLIHLLASMRDHHGRIRIEGFNDSIRPPSDAEKRSIRKIPFQPEKLLKAWELEQFAGPPEIPFHHKLMFQPNFNVCGFTGGYGGEGVKTVIPHQAKVKIDIRLVPDQDPADILKKIQSHIDKMGFKNIEMITDGFSYPPSRTSLEHPFCQAVIQAAEKGFGQEPVVYPSIGASAPNYLFTKVLGLPAVWATYSPPDERNHAPNENTTVDIFMKGVRTTAVLMERVARL